MSLADRSVTSCPVDLSARGTDRQPVVLASAKTALRAGGAGDPPG